MKAAMTRHTRKHLFAILLGLLPAFSFGSAVSARAASFIPPDQVSAIEPVDLHSSVDAQAATPANMSPNTNQGASGAQALTNSGIEGGGTPGPRFFFLIGLALIGVRFLISHRSKKIKSIATETH